MPSTGWLIGILTMVYFIFVHNGVVKYPIPLDPKTLGKKKVVSPLEMKDMGSHTLKIQVVAIELLDAQVGLGVHSVGPVGDFLDSITPYTT